MPENPDEERKYYSYYNPPKTFVKSAVRVMNVLEYFYRGRQPARAAEISRALDLPVSSTKYLLTSLVDSGYLTFDKVSKEYFPSILFAGFASWLAAIYPSGEILRTLARELQSVHGNTVYVVVQHDQYMRALIIETDSPTTPPAYDFRARIPLLGSASGLVALSARPDSEVADFVAQESRKLPPEFRADHTEQILTRIRQIRAQGYAVREHTLNLDGTTDAFMAVALPLPTDDKTPSMVLGICGPTSALAGTEAFLADAMKQAVDKYHGALQTRHGVP